MKFVFLLAAASVLTISFTELKKIETPAKAEAESSVDVDNYRVIKVNGRILYIRNGKDMLQGDIFKSNELLSFKTQESRAAVISKTKGRKILSPKDKSGSKATLLPAMNNPSSRSGAMINMIDLKNHFSGKYLVMGATEVEIAGESFPMNDQAFFFMRYEYNGETINKKLSNDGNKLIIDQDELYKIDGAPIEADEVSEMSLYYRSENKSTLVNAFTPVSPDESELRAEIQVILAELTSTDEETRLDEVTSYLNEYYGKPNKESLRVWLRSL